MTAGYAWRPYRDGDARAINDLYTKITGTTRSESEFEWQWLSAPGGNGGIWLIETAGTDAPKLVGHHGVMPVRFSNGESDLLFGKTENTMVLPDHRNRLLYPRFERRFANAYEPRFDALFSTFGDASAIRLRKAMGYDFSSTWVQLQIPTSRRADYGLLLAVLLRRLGLAAGRRRDASAVDHAVRRRTNPLPLRSLDDDAAPRDAFFDRFWAEHRRNFRLTPRRDKDDLNWRFWTNPYVSYVTLVSDALSNEQGYAIVRVNGESAVVEDIVPGPATAGSFARLLDSVLSWLSANSVNWANVSTTSDSCTNDDIASGLRQRQSLARRLRNRTPAARYMPRKLTASGKDKNLDCHDWYVTPIVFEGR